MIVFIDPNKVIIQTDRYRQDLGNIVDFSEKIKTTGGNLQAIQVYDNQDGTYELIAGERRTRACMLAGLQVKAEIIDDKTITLKQREAIENIERKQFTWREEIEAKEILTALYKAQAKQKGETVGLRTISDNMDMSVGGLSTDLNLAKALKDNPELFVQCKNKKEAVKTLQRFKVEEAVAELAKRKSKTDYGQKATQYVFLGDCDKLIESLPKHSINAIISDPKYGIDIETVSKGDTQKNIYKDDDTQSFQLLMESFIPKASKVLTQDAVICMFCSIQSFDFLANLWRAQGFLIDFIPGIWYKPNMVGQTNQPTKYFARSYEVFLYGFRGDATLVKQGTSNILSFPAVISTDKDHPLQKPVALLEELISRFCLPGHTILDFMCGSGSTIQAAIKRGCRAIGFEKDHHYYNIALNNISDALKAKDSGLLNTIGEI